MKSDAAVTVLSGDASPLCTANALPKADHWLANPSKKSICTV
jgi:hypothetical protein